MKNILSQEDAHAILGVKKCTVCGELKQLDQFYKRKQMLDGHRSKCKEDEKDLLRLNRLKM